MLVAIGQLRTRRRYEFSVSRLLRNGGTARTPSCIPARAGRDYCPEGAEFSYSGIAQRAIALARVYAEAGFGHGHRVALLLENRPEFFDHFLALNSLGVSIVPVNPDYVHNELVYQLDHSDAALVVALSSRVDDMQKAAQESALKPQVLDVTDAMTLMPKPVLRFLSKVLSDHKPSVPCCTPLGRRGA